MAVYDNRQMDKMRQDAIRRSQEMHRRSMVTSSHYSQGQQKNSEVETKSEPEQRNVNSQPIQNSRASARPPVQKDFKLHETLGKLFEGKIDSDKLVIIALMVILAKEGADMKLILALGYILL